MAKYELFRRDSGEVMMFIVLLFIALSCYVLKWSVKLILMGFRGEFEILAEFSGYTLYLTSVCPGLVLAFIIPVILIWGLPSVLHPKK